MGKQYIEIPGTAPSVTLGLDLSSVCVGYAVFEDLDLIEKNKYTHTGKHHCEKLQTFYVWLEGLIRRINPTHVVIEMPHGGNAGKALLVLTMYVTVVYMVYYKIFKREFPDSCKMYPSSVKSLLKVQTTGNHEQNKQVMVDHINKLFGLSLRYDKNKKNSDDDISDAIAVVVAWILRSGRDDGRYDSDRDRTGGRTKRSVRRR